ncbi:MAG: type II secretion system F family protein [Firmicutes bacterium]|nr:type II secretion system F family protein [Dethiobacter sp.]MBS3889182.1 type II secretion system F family protein [Bacillota bacterium]MBS4055658.1 type II secretion system F family protein [Thermaerobacter sp.]
MLAYVALVATLFIFSAALLLLQHYFHERLHMERRLEGVRELSLQQRADTPDEARLQLPLGERIIAPLMQSAGKALQAWAPLGLKTNLARRVRAAGLSSTAEQFAGWYIISGVGGFLLFTLLGLARFGSASGALYLGLPLGLVGALLPELVLAQRMAERQSQIVRALPDVLDLLTVSVNAGLGFDSALMKVTDKMKGPLPTEMGQVLHEIKMGVARRDALRSMAERTGVMELRSFVSTIIQADQLGVSISKVLRLQSEGLRERRRQRAEEMAMKAPVKMLLPLVLFIFPTLFIVLLGPAVLQIMASFAGM